MLKRLFNKLREIQPSPLGRWCLMDKSKNNWKVDMANTDHCGTCAYEETSTSKKQVQTLEKKKDLIVSNTFVK